MATILCAGATIGAQGRTVEYPASAKPKANWVLQPRPAVDLGGQDVDGPTAFSEIMGVVRLASGRMVVADASSTELRVFEADGRFTRSLGRKGQGPGEFNYLWSVFANGDTIFGVDNSGRVNVMDPDGRVLRTAVRPRVPNMQFPVWIGFFEDGSAVVQGRPMLPDSVLGEVMVPLSVMRQALDGSHQRELLQLDGMKQWRAPGKRAEFQYGGAIGRVVARGGRLCGGYSETFDLQCFDASGKSAVRIRRAVTRRPLTESDRAFYRDAYFDANKPNLSIPERAAQMREHVRRYQYADYAPTWSKLLLSAEGDLWVSEFDRTDQSLGTRAFVAPRTRIRYRVFDRNGAWLSDVQMPERFTPYDVGRDWILGVTVDEEGAERVTRWHFTR